MAETNKPVGRVLAQPKRKASRKELQAIRLAEAAGVANADRELAMLLTVSPALRTRLRAIDLAELVRFQYGNRVALETALGEAPREADALRAPVALRLRLRTLVAAIVAGVARLSGGRP